MSFDFTPTLNTLIILTVISPLFTYASRRTGIKLLADAYAIMAFAASLVIALTQFSEVATNGPIIRVAGEDPRTSTVIYVDQLAMYVAGIFIFIGLLASIFSVGYIEERKPEYYPLLLTMVTGMVGVAFAGDLFLLFIFWEMMSISSYLLVAFRYRNWEAVEASFKYLIISAAGAAAILFAMSFLYGMVGTLNIAILAETLATGVASGEFWSYVIIALLVAGFGVNAAMFPFHSWLPDAHPAAPSPISAMLSGVVIKTGIYALFRIMTFVFPATLFDWRIVLAIFAVLTMTVGNLMALLQEDIKRLLAFSSIAHIGYILLALSIFSVGGLAGGLLHILNHASMKALLFLAAGAFIHAAATRNIDELAGIGRTMPISAVAFAVGAFSLAGIPGLNTFWSEAQIIIAGIEAGFTLFVVIMIINILISVAYYLRLVQTIFFKPPSEKAMKAHDGSASMVAPLIFLSILAIVIGVYPTPFFETVFNIAQTLLASP